MLACRSLPISRFVCAAFAKLHPQYRTLRAGREFSIADCRYWGARYFSWKFLQCTLLQLEVTSMVTVTWGYGETWLRLLTLSFGHQRVFFGRPTPTTMYTVDILDPQRRSSTTCAATTFSRQIFQIRILPIGWVHLPSNAPTLS